MLVLFVLILAVILSFAVMFTGIAADIIPVGVAGFVCWAASVAGLVVWVIHLIVEAAKAVAA